MRGLHARSCSGFPAATFFVAFANALAVAADFFAAAADFFAAAAEFAAAAADFPAAVLGGFCVRTDLAAGRAATGDQVVSKFDVGLASECCHKIERKPEERRTRRVRRSAAGIASAS